MSYYLIHTTYPILFVAVFARQLCLPVPAILFLLSSGALAGAGKLSFAGILVIAVLGCVLADSVWFQAGRVAGKRVLRLLCALTSDPGYCIKRGRAVFQKRGVRLLLVAKFVPGLDGICPPLAGMLGASLPSFVAYDAGGASLWAGAYIFCGFLFAKQLDMVAKQLAVAANFLIIVLGIPLLAMFFWRVFMLIRMIQLLRPLQITPAELKQHLDSDEKFGVIDLLRFEDDCEGVAGIPGAIRLAPPEIRRKKRITIPSDVNIVIYCRSKNSFVSARVAAAMRKHGIRGVHVLKGGLDAWTAQGFSLSDEFADPAAELQRLGIEMTPSWHPPSTRP
ncbi:VTT domain-containing protein [Alloacidobacterium dinghuense]|uniref:VTT domain-containing protein n=1 Tax=Alloacidobacterium dinghuense TaxID=2763107 RepID=A0A7G8BHW5_9BACT|nr:VTT domain-containing protein [Alloacidobacterium dinghuense]QNI32135.1 VTT domain-containing protein [Alloacidobacterium dinghuense]